MKHNKCKKGSFTIEMSLIFPMILTVIVFIIYWSAFLHDRAILSSAAYTAALRGSQMINGEDIYSQVNMVCNQLINNRLLITKNITTDIAINKESITVNYSGILSIPAGTILCKYLSGGRNNIEINAIGNAKINDSVKFIRECRFIENATSKGKN